MGEGRGKGGMAGVDGVGIPNSLHRAVRQLEWWVESRYAGSSLFARALSPVSECASGQ